MRVGIALFPRLTQLDMTGPFEVFARMPETDVDVIARTLDPVVTDRGLTIMPTATLSDGTRYDVFVMPGGPGQADLMEDRAWLDFLDGQAKTARYVVGVCTGSLVLGAAGLLRGYRATTHWLCHDLLALLGAIPVDERVVFDRDRVTAAGVTSGIDCALALAGALLGDDGAREIQLQMEYAPDPPYDAGSTHTAPPALQEELRRRGRSLYEARREQCRRIGAALAAD
jgi:cyclohexyl-isocyanide hydratase